MGLDDKPAHELGNIQSSSQAAEGDLQGCAKIRYHPVGLLERIDTNRSSVEI